MTERHVDVVQPDDHLVPIDRTECILLLEARALGRVGATLRGLPLVYPVNYTVVDRTIVFRTRDGSALHEVTDGTVVAFEIDGKDTIYHEGWSVLVTGRATHVSDPAELGRLRQVPLTPWAGDGRDCYVRIALDEITGRRISHART